MSDSARTATLGWSSTKPTESGATTIVMPGLPSAAAATWAFTPSAASTSDRRAAANELEVQSTTE